MKFLVDNAVSPRVAQELTDHGHDAVHVKAYGMRDDPDEMIMERARVEGRVVVTTDLDFTRLAALTAQAAPSIIIFRQGAHNPVRQVKYILDNFDVLREPLEEGGLVIIEGGRIRLRRLPIGWREAEAT